jgi:hypothetical protein
MWLLYWGMEKFLNGIDSAIDSRNFDIGLFRSYRTALFVNSEKFSPIFEEIHRVFGDAMWDWLTIPAIALGGQRPGDLIMSDEHEAVLHIVAAIEHGTYL